MMEMRRHSVDAVPISRTLVALRRVKSLRDPSTNSMSKFSAFIDNQSWDTSSGNRVSLGLENVRNGNGEECHRSLRLKKFHMDGSDPETDHSLRKPDSKFSSMKNSSGAGNRGSDLIRSSKRADRSGFSKLTLGGICENRLSNGRSGNDQRNKVLGLTWNPHSSCESIDDLNSCSKLNLESASLERTDTSLLDGKLKCCKPIKFSGAGERAIGNRVDSASPSLSDPHMDGSNTSTSLFVNEEADVGSLNHRGCGISCRWSRTPKLRDPNIVSNIEDHPLLTSDGRETAHSGCETMSKRDLVLYSGTPRSLSQKFRPRFFTELVGQHVVTHSLLSAISKGKIATLYLFHGPRGTGKTSTSRIFAAALNCLSIEEQRPCGFCQECILFYTGKVRHVKEVDAAKSNHAGWVTTLHKHAALAPTSSRYKVFIIDECQLLREETWDAFLNGLDKLPTFVVFVMITADSDKIPPSALSRCQRFHFSKIEDVDIVRRLRNICVEEGLNFEKKALHFVAAKSNGSLRDAETMLDQLSLLGKRITVSLAYQLIGTVSDDELLDLLDLALSSDTPNTIKRARELMKSRIDPMQLISQLANLIMDILAGRCQLESSASGRKFFEKHTLADVDLQKLRHALKILSETEKQLRMTKNQTTWLTVALLQFSSGESTLLDGNDSKEFLEMPQWRDNGACDTCSMVGLNHSTYTLNHNGCHLLELKDETTRKLEAIWSRVIEKCQSNSLKVFLQKEGKLKSLCVSQGLTIAEVEFYHPSHVSKAEKLWKSIAGSLQLVLRCNVEIRVNLGTCSTERENAKVKRSAFSVLNCSCQLQEKLAKTVAGGKYDSDNSFLSSNGPTSKKNHKY